MEKCVTTFADKPRYSIQSAQLYFSFHQEKLFYWIPEKEHSASLPGISDQMLQMSFAV